MDVVAEEQMAADLHHVARDAVVGGADAAGAQELQLGRAERFGAGGVERLGPGGQLGGEVVEAPRQDFVGAGIEGARGGGGLFGHDCSPESV